MLSVSVLSSLPLWINGTHGSLHVYLGLSRDLMGAASSLAMVLRGTHTIIQFKNASLFTFDIHHEESAPDAMTVHMARVIGERLCAASLNHWHISFRQNARGIQEHFGDFTWFAIRMYRKRITRPISGSAQNGRKKCQIRPVETVANRDSIAGTLKFDRVQCTRSRVR